MRILKIVHSFVPYAFAGTEVYAYGLARELARKNDVFVFFRINDSSRKEYQIDIEDRGGFKACSINNTFKSCGSFDHTYKNPEIDKKLSGFLDEVKPDVAHVHHLLFLSHGLVDELRKRNIPIVYTIHDYWLLCYRGQLIKDDMSVCSGESISECRECLKYILGVRRYSLFIYRLVKKIAPPFMLNFLKRAHYFFGKRALLKKVENFKKSSGNISSKIDLFIAPSVFIKDKLISGGLPAEKVVFSSYGFDTKNFHTFRKNRSNLVRFGYMGTLLPAKGVDVLISGFKKIKNRDIELLIHGKLFSYSGFERFPGLLKKMASGDERIKFKGGYHNDDVARILSDIDILIVPSVWLENSPLVIREAFLSKTPVIVSRIGGIPELVDDGVNGLLFNPGDARDLQEKMEYVINNPGVIETFRNNMPEVKSIEENARELESIYKGLIAKNGRRYA